MNTQMLKLLVTISTSLALGGVFGYTWGNKPAQGIVPYALASTQAPTIVTKTQTVTKVIPGKPGECPTVEVTATGGSTIAPPTGGTNAVQTAYALGLSAQPRLGVPARWRLDGAVRLGNSPLMVTAGASLYQSNLIPDVGLRINF